MTVQIHCVPPDLAEPVLLKCGAIFQRGFETSGVAYSQLIEDLEDKRALLWIVLQDNEALATALTEIVDGKVCVFGVGGKKLRLWAQPLLDRLADYARAEGGGGVVFSGKKGWGRVLGSVRAVGVLRGSTVFERAA